MKRKILAVAGMMFFVFVAASYGADDTTSSAGQTEPQSLGAQAGESARQLKDTADENIATGAAKVAETSEKVQTEAQDTLKTLQQQWDVLAKQLQDKTRQIQALLQQQWQDFQKSFNKPS